VNFARRGGGWHGPPDSATRRPYPAGYGAAGFIGFLYIGCMPKFERHIFICTNQRPKDHPRGSCDPTGQGELQWRFKQKLNALGLKGRVRANRSGCLDQCEHGPNMVVYPEAVWYGGVKLEDVDEIIESHILGNRPVERLRIADSCLNAPSCPHRKPKP
jgi:(2Fe-2S) ferredoxin